MFKSMYVCIMQINAQERLYWGGGVGGGGVEPQRNVIIPEKCDLILTMRHSMMHRYTFLGLV